MLSPGHEYYDRGKKADLYAEEGVPWLWLLSPEARLLEVFRLRDGAWLRVGAWTDPAAPVLPPFEIPIPIERLFIPRPPPAVHEPEGPYEGA